MKKLLCISLCILSLSLCSISNAIAAKYNSWADITDEMSVILNKAYDIYLTGDIEQSKETVNIAYFGFYEKHGVERTVKAYISGKRASTMEYKFANIKRLIDEKASQKEVRSGFDEIITMLAEDSAKLDGKGEQSGWGIFTASLLILLREGFEAILVIAAIATYLVRSGNTRLTKVVYWSAGVAILASALLAFALQMLISISGEAQEMLEGFTMLFAVVVLFFVANWMISKAQGESWRNYIDSKVSSAASTGSMVALGSASFLAVFREGAESILFYQALLSEAKDYMNMFWLGIGTACICLAILFVVIRYGSLRIPLRPFFIGTSILMYIMAVSFAGGGIKELQAADVVSMTPVGFIDSFDLLGIYPTVETLLPQAIMLALAILSFVLHIKKKAASK